MKSIEVKEVELLPDLEEGHIFNTPDFNYLKAGLKKNFVLLQDELVKSRIWFTIEGTRAISGSSATFGSIDWCSNLSLAASDFVEKVLVKLKLAGIEEVIIKHWPLCYTMEYDESFFKLLGFEILHSEVNQHLIIKDEPFSTVIKNNERKKLNQSIKKGYTPKVLSVNSLPEVYDLVKNTRDRKGFPVSMSFDELSSTIEKLPDKYLLFGLYDGEKLIAATVSIRISRRVLYNFYHADALAYRSNSPLVLLVNWIYEFCQVENIHILDFGISSDKGILNQGLFTFKENLGCETSSKITYQNKNV